ncbi:MAG: hypothetical protein IPK16_26330 [Anaerolineales bacterium]|nr:hypothetical protein [Anaerolineales bacterium]
MQRIARQPNIQGAEERGALFRRIYLFGIALVGALVILFELAQVVYQLLLVLMGEPNTTLFSAETAFVGGCTGGGRLLGRSPSGHP